jgi:K+-sensing histidine kinase KdpD
MKSVWMNFSFFRGYWRSVWISLLTISITILFLYISKSSSFRILNPNLLFVLAVVWAAFKGGMVSGILSAVIAITYTLIDWSVPAHYFVYTTDNAHRIVVVIICMPAIALLVGMLKSQSDNQRKMLSLLLDLEKKKNKDLSKILDQKEFTEGYLPVCSWCRRARQDDGKWVELDRYLSDKYSIYVTHGICEECADTVSQMD